jgi:hypothetical protein
VVTIGGYDVQKYSKEDDLKWHNLINRFWWTLELQAVKLSGVDLKLETKQVIIDTGTSFTLMPKSDYRTF